MKVIRAILCATFGLSFTACDKPVASHPPATPPPAATPPAATPKSAEQIWQDVSPSLIYISARGLDGGVMQGSGFVVELDGKRLILTNRHVVKGAEKVSVGTDTKSLIVSSGYKIAANLDLAVVECPADVKAPALPRATRTLNPGAEVVALGFPLGIGKIITRGIVSSVEDGHILFDAPISSGNSGGPVVNHFGEVVAVATMGSKNTGTAIVQNLNLGIRVTAIPKLPLFTDPLIRLSAVADRIREVEAFIEKGYREEDWLGLLDVLLWHRMMESKGDAKPTDAERAKRTKAQLERLQTHFEQRHGSLRKAVERYVNFLKESEDRIDTLSSAFAGLGNDPILADFLKDERQSGFVRIRATPELLPKLARISADHWIAKVEDHRFRLEWSLRYTVDVPMPPPLDEFKRFEEKQRREGPLSERPTIRLKLVLSGNRQQDMENYFRSGMEWKARQDVVKDAGQSVLKKGRTETDPARTETLHGDLLSLISGFRQFLALEAIERGELDHAIALLRADIGHRAASCWSGALLAQQLVYAGKLAEAWQAYEAYFAGPPPFDAFQLHSGWGGFGGLSFAQMHISEGLGDKPLSNAKTQYEKVPSAMQNAERWNEQITIVEGRKLSELASLKETLLSDWFARLSRLSRIRVLTWFVWVKPDREQDKYYQKHGSFKGFDFKSGEDCNKVLATSPEALQLWEEISTNKKVGPLL